MDRKKKKAEGNAEPRKLGYTKTFSKHDSTSPAHELGSKSTWSKFEYNLSEEDGVTFTIMHSAGPTLEQTDLLREAYKEDCAETGREFDEQRFQRLNGMFEHQFTCTLEVEGDQRSWFTQPDEDTDTDTKEVAKEFLRRGLDFFKGGAESVLLAEEKEEAYGDPDGEDDEEYEPGSKMTWTLHRTKAPGVVSFHFKLETDDGDEDMFMNLACDEKTLRQMFLDAMYRYDPNYED